MSTFNAPPDQISGLTLNNGDTLNLGQGGTVSAITVLPGSNFNMDGGTAVDTILEGASLTVHDGVLNGITFEGILNNLIGSVDILQLPDPSSLEGTLTFNNFEHGSYSANSL